MHPNQCDLDHRRPRSFLLTSEVPRRRIRFLVGRIGAEKGKATLPPGKNQGDTLDDGWRISDAACHGQFRSSRQGE
jgi:hypothetical protein